MSEYQAVYDAVRSRISNGNVGDAIREVAWQALDISLVMAMAREQICFVAMEMTRPSVLYRPTVGLDGNMYSVLYGENLMDGCAGFGSTLAEAMADFDKNWTQQKAPTLARPARDTDRSPEGGDAKQGSTRSARAGAEGIAKPSGRIPRTAE